MTDEVQDGIRRAADVLGSAKLVVGSVASNRFNWQLLNKNQELLRVEANVLREVAKVLDALADELPRDYSNGAAS